eukprot:2021997-Rhodomonas_salina.1
MRTHNTTHNRLQMRVLTAYAQALAAYFGEDAKTFNPNDFFAHVNSFVEQFEVPLSFRSGFRA